MSTKDKILEGLFDILKKLNDLDNPDQVTEILLAQPQLPEFLLNFINSSYYDFNQKIEKKENILFILGYKLLSAIILSLILYLKYKVKHKEKLKEILKEAIKEGFKYSEAAKNEEAFLLGFISKIKKYFSQNDLEEIFRQAHFPPSIIYMENSNIVKLVNNLNKKDLQNIEKYSQILMDLIEDYVQKLRL